MNKFSGILLSLLLILVSCQDRRFQLDADAGSESHQLPARTESEEVRQVMLMVSAGYNDLNRYLKADQKEIAASTLPQGYRSAHVLLVLSRLPEDAAYVTTQAPVLYRMYADLQGGVVRDTVKVWDREQPLDAQLLKEALELTYLRFPAKGYGLVFSSHGSGWLPSGYFYDPSRFEPGSTDIWSSPRLSRKSEGFVFPPLGHDPEVKSVGEDGMVQPNTIQMEIKDFADAIPFHLQYVLLDACLMGCVEVAWELRDKADIVGFSPAEILANGFNYTTLTGHLLQSTPDPVAVCQDYFDQYDKMSGRDRSATISAIDTRKMDALAQLCKQLFQKYRNVLQTMNAAPVQGYFRYERHFFYDLQDILVKAGITQEEKEQLQQALDACVLYKAATPSFLGYQIHDYCGMSMYLPVMGSAFLDNYYKSSIAWNQATELIK